MLTFQTARVVLFIYSLLLAGGGVMGFVKAGSRPSLIAGLGCAAATLLALGVSFWRPYEGLVLATIVALFLGLFFNYRFVTKSRKFMPSGLLAVISVIVLAVMIITVVSGS